MRESLQEYMKIYVSKHRSRKAFRKFVQVMGCVVAFVTTYALILPAITMEKTAFCGFEEHTHNEACYQLQIERRDLICTAGSGLHVHSSECYHENGSVICGMADYIVHSHDDFCRNSTGELVCALPERSQHIHSSACYYTPEPVPHIHGDTCMADVKGELTCTQQVSKGHRHSESCYHAGSELLCTKPVGHQHEENCYITPLNCTLSIAPHTHDSSCYTAGAQICSIPENHIHQGECIQTELVCGQLESDHTHEPDCYTAIQSCVEEHEHTDDCWEKTLSCGVSVHRHSDVCYESRTVCDIQEGHIHDSSCYEQILNCGKAEGEVHEHVETCYDAPQLNCSLEVNHTHDDTCYQQELICQIPESEGHEHLDACYDWKREYVCGLEEGQLEEQEPELVCAEPAAPSHSHGEGCFEVRLVEAEPVCNESHEHTYNCYQLHCIVKEHTHSAQCYSDPDADVETRQYWESTMRHVALTEDWNANVVAIAESQLGYTESTRNYTVWEDESRHGYTRYGAWYGVPHGDWCAMFASFCLEYAGVEGMPYNYGVRPWIEQLTRLNLYRTAEEYIPVPGDLVFFDWAEQDGFSDHVGIVYEVIGDGGTAPAKLKTIEGNSSNRVQFVTYDLNDAVLLGYSMLPKNQSVPVYYCGLEAHEHGEACMDAEGNTVCQLPEHQHEESCLVETPTEPVYYCGLEVHEHGEACMDAEGNTVCQLPEHQHEESCLAETPPEPVYYCGLEVHEHGEACMDAEGNTVCQLPEHQHEESCLVETPTEPVYYCGLEAHEHGEACMDAEGNTVCQLPEHQHEESCLVATPTESVYYCDLEEHIHDAENCYDLDGNLTCEKVEHKHVETCLQDVQKSTEYSCEMQEHLHGENCFDETGALSCQLPEHLHSDDCLKPKTELEQSSIYAQIYTDSTYSVLSNDTMQIMVTGMLPAGARICAYPIVLESELQVLCAYEIEILQPDGTIFEPAEGESLNVTFQSSFLEEQEDMQVYYIPEEGEPEAVDTTVTEAGIAFEAPHFSTYAVMTTAASVLEPFDNGVLSYSWNQVTDAFIYDPQYASFYNVSSPLGTAGSFHIVGFDTVTLNSHTNGNILAKTLVAINNFGTNSKNDVDLVEISYVQNYQSVNSNSSADIGDYLVVGSDNTVSLVNNGFSLAVNGIKIDKPNNIIHDVNTAETPFINLDRVEAEINAISANLSSYATSGESVMRSETSGSNPYLELVSADNVGIYNLTSSELEAINGNEGWSMRGFVSGGNGAIVINVDCADANRSEPLLVPKSRVYVDGNKVPLEETLDFSAGKVIWNFVNAYGLQIETTEMTGMVIAPGATVNIGANLNGTVVAENVNVNAESHRTDFAGRVIPTEHIDGAHIHVYKVDKNNYGKFLQGAKFTLYEWNGVSWVIASQNSQDQIDITDAEGKVIFQDLTYNVAYRLEETQAPPGYRISTDHQYYYFEHPDTETYPVRKPSGFKQSDAEDCIIHYYPNEATDVDVTSVHLEKKWRDDQNRDLTVTPWDSVQVEITRGVSHAKLDSDGNFILDDNGQIIYGEEVTVSVLDTVAVYASDGWTKTLSNLPVTSDDRKEKYTYSAREIGTDDVLLPDKNGIVPIINRVAVTYVPLALQKNWDGDIPEDFSEITLQLYRMFRRSDTDPWSEPEPVLDPIVLKKDNNWQWSAQENTLIKKMAYGEDTIQFAYFAVETSVPDGYYPDYHSITQQTPLIPADHENSLEVTNHMIQYTDLHITKVWQDYYGNPLTEVPEGSVTVQVEQSADGGTTWTAYGEPIEITQQNGWQYDLTDLPLENNQGQQLSYRVEEKPMLGYLSSGGTVGENGEVSIVNRQIKTTSLRIRKIWQAPDGSQLQQHTVNEIQIQLLRSVNDGPWQDYKEPMSVKKESGWQLLVEGLPLTDPVLKEDYRYTVKELNVSDLYESSVSEVTDETVTVTNTRKIETTDVLVEKRWYNSSGTEYYANSGSVEVKLYQIYHPAGYQGGSSGETVNVTVKLTQYGDEGSIFAANTYTVPAGTKINVTLYTQGSDYPKLYAALPSTSWDKTEVAYHTSSVEGSRKTRTFEYTANTDILLIGQTGHWNMAECGGSSSYVSAAADGKLYETVVLNVANGWKHQFSQLPVYSYDEMHNVTGDYFYYVEETEGSQYSVTYTDANGNPVGPDKPVSEGTIIVRNRLSDNLYVMPETGGAGSGMYYGMGLLLICISLLLMIHTGRRRRGVP